MSDAFDKKFREKLSEPEVPFDPDAWKKMEKKLDALNDDGSSRRTFWWWLAPLLLLLLGTGAFLWWHNSSPSSAPEDKVAVQTTDNTKTIPQPGKQTLPPEEKTNTLPGKESSPENTDGAQQPITPGTPLPTPQVTTGDKEPAIAAAKPKPAPVKQRVPSPVINRQQPAAAPVLSYREQNRAANPDTQTAKTGITNNTGDHNNNNILHLLSTLYPENAAIPATLKGSSRIPLKEPVKEPVEKSKKKEAPPRRKGFSIGLMLGPVFNVAPSLQYGQVGLDGGLLLNYHVNNRWSFTTGAVYSQKPYGGTRSDYGVTKNYPPPYNPDKAIKYIDANCGVLDVPLNVNYTFKDEPNYALSFTAGVSSYFMLREKYIYKYQNADDGEKEFTNQNRHYFSVLNLAFTYQFPLNNHISLGIQPFAKIPMGRVGYGEVRLYSTGVAVQMNFNRFKRTQR